MLIYSVKFFIVHASDEVNFLAGTRDEKKSVIFIAAINFLVLFIAHTILFSFLRLSYSHLRRQIWRFVTNKILGHVLKTFLRQ
jgi:hypothetical protein